MTVDHSTLEPGSVILGPNDERVEILADGVLSAETVGPLVGRDVWRYWARDLASGREGFMSYGRGGIARLA